MQMTGRDGPAFDRCASKLIDQEACKRMVPDFGRNGLVSSGSQYFLDPQRLQSRFWVDRMTTVKEKQDVKRCILEVPLNGTRHHFLGLLLPRADSLELVDARHKNDKTKA